VDTLIMLELRVEKKGQVIQPSTKLKSPNPLTFSLAKFSFLKMSMSSNDAPLGLPSDIKRQKIMLSLRFVVKCKTKIYTLFCSQKEKGMGALK
jgi:hypothetical protein